MLCGPQIISGDIKLATDTHRPTQTFCLLDLSEQKISSLCDIKYYLTEKLKTFEKFRLFLAKIKGLKL